MLIESVVDYVDNYVVQAGDVGAHLWRGYSARGWEGWSGTWPMFHEPLKAQLVRAMVELDDSSLVIKQGVSMLFGVLVRRGTGIVRLNPLNGNTQGYGTALVYGPADFQWGVAACFPTGVHAAGDTAITSITLRRYLP